VEQALTYDKALQSATRMLAGREHSVLEMTRKLQQKAFSADIVDEVIAGLVQANVLSDTRFADVYVRMRSSRGHGPTRIRMELQERGVDAETIDSAFEENAIDWAALAVEVRQRKFGEALPQDFAGQAKQMRFLQYRGFTQAHINAAVKGLG
jgi:regulatory protein